MDSMVNHNLERLFRWLVTHPKWVISIGLLAFLLAASQLTHIRKDSRADAFLDPQNPALIYKNKVKEAFGLSDPMVIAVVNEADPGVYTPATLKLIDWLSQRLRRTENIDPERVVSLATENNIVGNSAGMDVTPFYEPYPDTPARALEIRDAVADFPLYQGNLVSRDGVVALIVAEVIDDSQAEATYQQLLTLTREAPVTANETLHVAGEGAVSGFLGSYIDADAKRLNPLAGVIITIMLIIAFRRLFPAFSGNLIIAATVLMTLGLMAASGVPFYVITNAMPVILIGMAVADSIHVLSRYYEIRAEAPDRSLDDVVVQSMMDMWRPITLTTLTTACGFLGLYAAAYMPPFKYFGLFTALGVMLAWVYSLLLLPALLMVIKPKPSKRWCHLAQNGRQDIFAGLMSWLGGLSLRFPRVVIGIFSLLAAVSIYFAAQLRVDYDRLETFHHSEPIYQADRTINRHLDGINYLDIVIESDRQEGVFNPELLNQMEQLQQYALTLPHVRGATSIVDYLKQMNRALNENRPEAYTLPQEQNLIAQYFLLYSASSDPTDFEEEVDYDYRTALIRLNLDSSAYSDARPVIESLQRFITERFPVAGAEAHLSGRVHVNYHWIKDLGRSHFLGVTVSLSLVWLVSALLFGSVVAGLMSLLPVLSAIVLVYAAMVVLGIDLGIGTSMFASVAIGLGVDFAIHTIDRLRELLRDGFKNEQIDQRMNQLFPGTGRALLFNYLAIAFGFGVLISSRVVSLNEFGTIVVLAVSTSFITSLTLVPALIKVIQPRFIQAKDQTQRLTRDPVRGAEVQGGGMPESEQPSGATTVVARGTTQLLPLILMLSVLGTAAWPFTSARAADDRPLTANDIIAKLNGIDDGEYASSRLSMRLVDRHGKTREREALSFRRYFGEEKRTVLFYTDPANVEGTAFLTYDYPDAGKDDDQWLYLPALRKVRRISASDRGDYFLGTDFTYEDIKKSGKIADEDHTFTLMGMETMGDHKVYQVEAIPVDEDTADALGYSRALLWVDAAIWVARRIDYWDIAGNPLKMYEVKQLEQVDNIWTRLHMVVHNHKTGHSTEFYFNDVDYQTPVDEDRFTKRAMTRGI